MPTKGARTLERLQAFGAVAAEGARNRLANEGEASCDQLTCEYRGVATQDEEYVINEIPARRSTIAYQWYVCPNRYVFVSKSIQHWLRIILGFLPYPTKQPRFGNDFLPKGTRF